MRYATALALAVGLAAASSAGAGDFVADSSADLSLKAPGGYFEQQLYEITPAGPSALRARITLGKFDPNPDWATSFHFAVLNGDDYLSFQIVRTDDNQLITYFRKIEKGTDKAVLDFDFKPREAEAFTVLMEWTPEGKVTASVGRDGQMERHEAEFGHAPQKLRVLASGGSMDVTPLELGRMTPVIATLRPPGAFRPASAPQASSSTAMACAAPTGTRACRQRR